MLRIWFYLCILFLKSSLGGISLVKDPTHRRWHLAWKSILDLGSAFRIGGLSMCSSFFKERSCLIPFWWLKKTKQTSNFLKVQEASQLVSVLFKEDPRCTSWWFGFDMSFWVDQPVATGQLVETNFVWKFGSDSLRELCSLCRCRIPISIHFQCNYDFAMYISIDCELSLDMFEYVRLYVLWWVPYWIWLPFYIHF